MRGEARSRLLAGSGRGVLVAVVDSGWSKEIEHSRVRPQLGVHGELDVPGGDVLGHGTACILRVLQVAPDAEIVPIRVFQNRLETSVGVLCDAIRTAQNLGAGIINLSLATRRTDATEPLYRVCEEARREGVVLVAAADNGGGHAIPAFLLNHARYRDWFEAETVADITALTGEPYQNLVEADAALARLIDANDAAMDADLVPTMHRRTLRLSMIIAGTSYDAGNPLFHKLDPILG